MTETGRDLVLRFFGGPASIGPIAVSPRRPTALGRGATCPVRIDHPSVSESHASLARTADRGWTITDLGSTNGTYLDDMALDPHDAATLGHRCLLGVGAWVFQILVPASDRAPAEIKVERSTDAASTNEFQTNPTIFLRLRHDDSIVRELSWEEFDRSYRPVILGFARNLGLPARDREDVLQIVLTKFFEIDDFQYDPSGRFRGFLKCMTRQAITDHLQREHGERKRAIEHALRNPHEVEDRWNREWSIHLIRRAMELARPSFGDTVWESFVLTTQDGLTANEAADALSSTPEAVRQAKGRVRSRVREILREIRSTED